MSYSESRVLPLNFYCLCEFLRLSAPPQPDSRVEVLLLVKYYVEHIPGVSLAMDVSMSDGGGASSAIRERVIAASAAVLASAAEHEGRARAAQQLEIVVTAIPEQLTVEKLGSQPLWGLQARCRPRDPI